MGLRPGVHVWGQEGEGRRFEMWLLKRLLVVGEAVAGSGRSKALGGRGCGETP